MGRPYYSFDQFQETARCRDAQHGGGVCCALAPELVYDLCCVESDAAGDVGSRSNMRSVPGHTDPDSRDGGASQRTSGEQSSLQRNDSPEYASDDQRPFIYIIPAIIVGLMLIIAGAVAIMFLWKRRQQRSNLGKISFLWLTA